MGITQRLTPHCRLLVLLPLSLLGAFITQIYPKSCFYFWLAMLWVLGFVSIASNYWQRSDTNTVWVDIALHWGGSAFGIAVVCAFRQSGRLYDEETGLLILLMLAVGAFTGGLKSNWRDGFVGVFLGLIAIAAAFFDTYLGQLALLAAGAGVFSYFHNPGINNLNGESGSQRD